jgi:hypothetical protein
VGIVLLSVTALTLGVKNRIGVRLQSLANEQMRMSYLAREGFNRCLAVLAEETNGFDALSEPWSKDLSLQNEDGLLSCTVVDEDRLMNINTAPHAMMQSLKTVFPLIDEDMVAALEKARPFNVIREVLDTTGLSRQDFYGDPAMGIPGMPDLLTVFSDGRININTAPKEVLAMIPDMSDTALEAILSRRITAPFEKNETLSEELSLLGLTPAQVSAVVKAGKVDSAVFHVTARAVSRRKHIAKKMELVIKRQDKKFIVLMAKEN